MKLDAAGMTLMARAFGFHERDDGGGSYYCHKNIDGRDHIITVACVQGGWQFVWQRGPTLTIDERGGFATLEDCMKKLWECIFKMTDRYQDLLREQAVRTLKEQS